MKNLRPKGTFTIGYAILISIAVASFLVIGPYAMRSLCGAWRKAVDVFGHGVVKGDYQEPEEAGMVAIQVIHYNIDGAEVLIDKTIWVFIDGSCSAEPEGATMACWRAYEGMVVFVSCSRWCEKWGLCYSFGNSQYPSKWRQGGGDSWHLFKLGITGD